MAATSFHTGWKPHDVGQRRSQCTAYDTSTGMGAKHHALALVVWLPVITYAYTASETAAYRARGPCSESMSASELASFGLTLDEATLLAKDACLSADEVYRRRSQAQLTSVSSAWVPTNSGIPDNVECEPETWCDSGNVCSIVCKRGTVRIGSWLKHALDVQLQLARRQPLCTAQLLGSHNAAITLADGYGNRDPLFMSHFQYVKWVAPGAVLKTNNQLFSMTDQLNLGARVLEIDVHWFAGQLRIGHCGGFHVPVLDRLLLNLNALAKVFGHELTWDTETFGCSPSLSSIPTADQRPFVEALREVADWLDAPGNEQEFVVLFFDNQMDLQRWGKVPLLMSQIAEALPLDAVLTPREWREQLGGRWPSMEDLVHRNKRLLLVSGEDYGAEMDALLFPKVGPVCGWDEPQLPDFSGPMACNVAPHNGKPGGATEQGTLVRILSCEIQYGPLNCDLVWGHNQDVLDDSVLPNVIACGCEHAQSRHADSTADGDHGLVMGPRPSTRSCCGTVGTKDTAAEGTEDVNDRRCQGHKATVTAGSRQHWRVHTDSGSGWALVCRAMCSTAGGAAGMPQFSCIS